MISKIWAENNRLIKEHNLKVGSILKLKRDTGYFNFNTGDCVTISFIHSLYGWVRFKETEQLSQEVSKILSFSEIAKKEMALRELEK